jgi:hypothetical protein
VNERSALAKARLRTLAADADAYPALALRAADAIRAHPWSGVAVALLAGVALGAGRRCWSGAMTPFAVPLLGRLATAFLRSPDPVRRPTIGRRAPRARRTS